MTGETIWMLVIGAGGLWAAWMAGKRDGRAEGTVEAHKEFREEIQAVTEKKNGELAELKIKLATLEQQRANDQDKLQAFENFGEQMKVSFAALSANALKDNNSSFLELANAKLETTKVDAEAALKAREAAITNLVEPIQKSLKDVDSQIRKIETERAESFGTLNAAIRLVSNGQEQLRSETSKLVQALRRPEGRGRWGELQLRRVVEMAGMVNHCDFVEQEVADSGQRPDMVVQLPGNKQVIVDSKVPLDAYLKAIESGTETERAQHLASHARHIHDHIAKLSAKKYWEQFENAPEFVVLFLPGEFLFSAALQENPALIEEGATAKVIVATPTTLIAILRAVAYGWQQTKLAENAQKISDLGRKLYEALRTMGEHMEKLGNHLGKAVDSYNSTVGSMERNVFSSARRFPELGVGEEGAINELEQKDHTPRLLQAPDWEKKDSAKA